MADIERTPRVTVVGGGFAGLAAGYELSRQGVRVTLVEAEATLGGLAGSFLAQGKLFEKFYHHGFAFDESLVDLITELGVHSEVICRASSTGMYFNNQIYRLSSPWDVVRFSAIPVIDRLRLVWLALRSRCIKDWKPLEGKTAMEWLVALGGQRAFEVVWEPLLRRKFGRYADQISAVHFWSTLNVHGGTRRGRTGGERLWYYRGGFGALAERIASEINRAGGEIRTSERVEKLLVNNGSVRGVQSDRGTIESDAVISTIALPLVADLVEACAPEPYVASLRRIEYLANLCLVLLLDRSLSATYWLSVNDPEFPFVGIVEHTNFEPASSYQGLRVAYLSRYLSTDDPLYRMTTEELLEHSVPYIQRMFPDFQRTWIRDAYAWRARWAQPIVVKHYSTLIPAMDTPINGLYLASMAQIYPEDRGINRAIREGRRVARHVNDRVREQYMQRTVGQKCAVLKEGDLVEDSGVRSRPRC